MIVLTEKSGGVATVRAARDCLLRVGASVAEGADTAVVEWRASWVATWSGPRLVTELRWWGNTSVGEVTTLWWWWRRSPSALDTPGLGNSPALWWCRSPSTLTASLNDATRDSACWKTWLAS